MGTQKNIHKNEKEKKKIAAVQYIFQVTNELPFVLSKRTFSTAKEKWLKEYKTI